MNKALEFLEAASDAYPLLRDRQMWKMKHFVELAKGEVTDLVRENYLLRQRLARYEAPLVCNHSIAVAVSHVIDVTHAGLVKGK